MCAHCRLAAARAGSSRASIRPQGRRTPVGANRWPPVWLVSQTRSSWTELTATDLAGPVNPANDEILTAWHQANADRFTAPEIRKISYVWMTPDMLADTVELDETALRELYDAKAAEYIQPARRLVGRLVFENTDAAAAANADR